jgi:hypothetical protein
MKGHGRKYQIYGETEETIMLYRAWIFKKLRTSANFLQTFQVVFGTIIGWTCYA